MWNLIELYANMDLAQLAALVDVELLPSLGIMPLLEPTKIGDVSTGKHLSSPLDFTSLVELFLPDVVTKVGKLIEDHMDAQSLGNDENE